MIFVLQACKCSLDNQKRASEREAPQPGGSNSEALFKIRFTPKWYHQAQHAGSYMAREKGFYQKYGLDVEIIAGSLTDITKANLNEGKTDISTLFLLAALANSAEGEPLVNLAQLFQHSTLMLVGKKSRGINTLQSIKGKKIGLWGSDNRDLSMAFLQNNHLDPQVLEIDRTNTLFLHDVVDVINVMYYNEYHWLLMSGIEDDDLFKIRLKDVGYDIPEDGIYTSRSFYESHPRECADFVRATLEGWEYAFEHPEETLQVVIRLMKESYLPANISHQRWMLDKLRETIILEPGIFGHLQKDDFEAAKKILLPRIPSLKSLSYEEFYPDAKL